MRYQWPDDKQSAAALSFDFDAESGFLFREPEKAKRSLGDLEERRRTQSRLFHRRPGAGSQRCR